MSRSLERMAGNRLAGERYTLKPVVRLRRPGEAHGLERSGVGGRPRPLRSCRAPALRGRASP